MSKIRSVIKINSGYTSYVDLNQEFLYYNEEQNRGRIERYMPIKAHRIAFDKIANSLNPKDRRCYFLSGSYGTGKSHLCLMLGNYFAVQSNSLEMETFFKNYEISQKEVLLKPGETLDEVPATGLSAKRKNGKFLVAICRYGLKLEFEGVVLRALEEALDKHKAKIKMETHFNESVRRLQEWEKLKSEKPFYKNFVAELKLKHSDWTFAKLKKRLIKADEEAFAIFKLAFKEVTDNDFTFSKDNLQDILSDILTNESFKKEFNGIVIIYDEFGDALDENRVVLSRFQEFAQYCANSGLGGLPTIFIGTGHKPFPKHGKVGDAVHYSKLSARVSEVPLQTQGMEDIIAAIVQQKKNSDAWKNEVEPNSDIFAQFTVECKRLGIFNWLPAPKLKNNIIENIYPMHPLATYALLQMARELGSDNRSVFKFFSPEFEDDSGAWKNVQKYSYPWFAENNDILQNDRLKLFTTDVLFDYFKDSITEGGRGILERIRLSISNYEATLRSLKSYVIANKDSGMFDEVDETVYQILKVILVNEIISNEEYPIVNIEENIHFGLNAATDSHKQEITNRLEFLWKKGILYRNDKQVYEFRKSDIQDIGQMVIAYKQDPENKPEDIKSKFFEFVPLAKEETYLVAKNYNTNYNEDKRLKINFATPTELEQSFKEAGQDITFFEKLEIERKITSFGNDSFDGNAIYVFCETDEEVEQAKKLCIKNTSERIVIGIPKKGMGVSEPILSLLAIEDIKKSKQAESFGPHENSQLLEIRKEAELLLKNVKNNYFDNKYMSWFSAKGASLPVSDANRYDAADKVASKIFETKRNAFSHSDFNKAHLNVSSTIQRILTEAGDLLLDLTQSIKVDWSHPDNRGDKKYLRRCFVDNQIIKMINQEGDIRYFEVERDISKFEKALPAYAKLLDDLASLEGKGAISCTKFIEPYFEEYGQGQIALTLLVLLARRYYGDSLRFKREKDALTDILFDKTERIIDLISGKEPNAVIIFKGISKEDTDYFSCICSIFTDDGIVAGKKYGINEAHKCIVGWWKGLPIIAKSDSFYEEELKPFIHILNKAETKDPFGFIKYDLVSLFGVSKDEKITTKKLSEIKAGLEKFKKTASQIQSNKEENIIEKVGNLFNSKSSLPIDVQDTIKSWYEGLDGFQKDVHGKYHNNESKVIIKRIQNMSEVKKLIYEEFPEAFGFGNLENWGTDKTDDYIGMLKKGKEKIEQSKSPVCDVSVLDQNGKEIKTETVSYKGGCGFKFSVKDDVAIYYTDDGSDPSDDKSEREKYQTDKLLTIKKGNRTIRTVACDKDGNYGKIRRVSFIDDTAKNIIRPVQRPIPGNEVSVTFIFPVDKEGVRTSISSLFKEVIDTKVIGITELENLVNNILKKLKS